MENEIFVILDNIRSAENVGSIFRTAEAVRASKIFLCGITPTPVDILGRPRPRLKKTSLGAENFLAWETFKKIAHLLDRLKKDGFLILAVEQTKNSVSYRLAPNIIKKRFGKNGKKRIALVLGNEIKGVSRGALSRSDFVLEIPMAGRKESLNVAVAFGIVAFNL